MKVFCPHCSQKYKISESQLGDMVDCHNCDKRFELKVDLEEETQELSLADVKKPLGPKTTPVFSEDEDAKNEDAKNEDSKAEKSAASESDDETEKEVRYQVDCAACKQKYKIKKAQFGKRIKCRKCDKINVFKLPPELNVNLNPAGKLKVASSGATPSSFNSTQSRSTPQKKRFSATPLVAAVLLAGLGVGGYFWYTSQKPEAPVVVIDDSAEEEARLEREKIAAEQKRLAQEEAQREAERKARREAEEREKALRDQKLALAKSQSYEGKIVPILENYCTDCHNEVEQEGDLNLELYFKEEFAESEPDLWEKIGKVVSLQQMPPVKSDQLNEDEKNSLYEWIDSLSDRWAAGEMGQDPGKTTIHRLNKYEYNYTIRDLFGFTTWLVNDFPEDGASSSGFTNNADALYFPTLLFENYYEAAEKVIDIVYGRTQTKTRYLFKRPILRVTPSEAAKEVLTYWASKIYRRDATDKEVTKLLGIFEAQMAKTKNYDEAMKMPLFAMLVSPKFLYRSTATKDKPEISEVGGLELASRLSYFLWSSMPDKELLSLAKSGELSKEEVLIAQTKRMLLDKKASSLGKHLGGQWFGWEDLRSAANPDQTKFPEFDFQLRTMLYQESTLYFNHIVTNDGSVYDLLDSDYAFLNERLAKFYGLPNIKGNNFRLVKLEDRNRGGVIGMGSVLTATSTALRSSPSIRGAYVVRDLLGINLPEPPMNIEPLADDDKNLKNLTARETLIEHSENPNCKACHQEIDPIGFGLEAYDAIGRIRTHQNGVKLDLTGKMPDGSTFSSPDELKASLLNFKEQFAENTAKKLLTYALGRELSPYDRPEVKRISEAIIETNGSMHTAIISVVTSYPFRNQRGDKFKVSKPNS